MIRPAINRISRNLYENMILVLFKIHRLYVSERDAVFTPRIITNNILFLDEDLLRISIFKFHNSENMGSNTLTKLS
jgi:hypothetical protein